MNELIGRKINALHVTDDQQALVFDTDKGELMYVTEGDCCSETWFADILGVSSLIGHTVQGEEDIDLSKFNPEDGRSRQEVDQIYGHKLVTDAGYVDIVYRNSSNGYYGGSAYLDEYSPRPVNLIPITEDWTA